MVHWCSLQRALQDKKKYVYLMILRSIILSRVRCIDNLSLMDRVERFNIKRRRDDENSLQALVWNDWVCEWNGKDIYLPFHLSYTTRYTSPIHFKAFFSLSMTTFCCELWKCSATCTQVFDRRRRITWKIDINEVFSGIFQLKYVC